MRGATVVIVTTQDMPDGPNFAAALALAVRAPSVHNSQPWRWHIGDARVELYADRARHLPHIDPTGRDLLLSCGVALQHFTVALSALGWESKVFRFPNPAAPDHLASIEIVGPKFSEPDIALAAAIPRRRTDRRWFSPWPVPAGDIALMASRAARWGVSLRRVADQAELAAVVASAVREHLVDPEYLAELTLWSGRHGTDAGVPARSTPMPDRRGKFPARVFANPVLQQPGQVVPGDDAGAVLVLATATDDAIAQLEAGEATGAALLTATALGLAVCPLTEPLELADTRAAVRSKLLGGTGFPQMLLRVGWAALNADPLPATPRRQLVDVAFRLDGGPLQSTD